MQFIELIRFLKNLVFLSYYSQNNNEKVFWVGRNPERSLSPTPGPAQGHPQQSHPESIVQMFLEFWQLLGHAHSLGSCSSAPPPSGGESFLISNLNLPETSPVSWLCSQRSELPHCCPSATFPSFWHPPIHTKSQPTLQNFAEHRDPLTANYHKCCSALQLREDGVMPQLTPVSTIRRAPLCLMRDKTILDKLESWKGRVWIEKQSHNWVGIVLSAAGRHTMPKRVISSPNNFRQCSQEWQHQLIPCLLPPKINFPATHPQFICQVAVSVLCSQLWLPSVGAGSSPWSWD